MTVSAERKMTLARFALVADQPFWGSLAMNLDLVADPTCKTAWVDGRRLGFNPTFVEPLTHDEAVGLVAHEVEHVALGHPWRRDGRDKKEWNIAADKAINHDLRDAGFKLPANAYYAEGEEKGKSAEWIYSHTERPQAPQPQPEPQQQPDPEEDKDEEQDEQQGDGDGDQTPDDDSTGDEDGGEGEGGAEGEGDGNADGEGSGDGKPGDQPGNGGGDADDEGDPLGEVRDAPTGPDTDGEPAPTEQDWKERVAAAAVFAKGQGKLPAGMERQVERAMRSRVDVKSLLLRFFTERAAADYTWSRPNRRYLPMGIYLPSLEANGLGEIAMYVDTSGSMSVEALEKAKAIIDSVIEECRPAAVTVYYGDSDVAHVDRFEQGEELVWRAKGGGGTDFRPIFTAVEQAERQVVAVVGISDLDGAFPDYVPDVPTLWLSTEEYATAPFGEVVYLDE